MTPQHITAPIHMVRDNSLETSRMWFPDKSPVPSSEYDVRGGVCWPIPTPDGGIVGFACVIGRDIRTGVYHWLAESPFVCIDHVVEAGRVAFEGIAPWFSSVWSAFGLMTWYYSGDRDGAWRHILAINDSPHVHPKPSFQDIEWSRHEHAIGVMRALRAAGRLAVPRASAIPSAEAQHSVLPPETPPPPELRAYLAAILGMERYPWMEWG